MPSSGGVPGAFYKRDAERGGDDFKRSKRDVGWKRPRSDQRFYERTILGGEPCRWRYDTDYYGHCKISDTDHVPDLYIFLLYDVPSEEQGTAGRFAG